MDLEEVIIDREVGELSGGELQRFAIAVCCALEADVSSFDEPSYLDVKQRHKAAQAIRTLCKNAFASRRSSVIAVEHDLRVGYLWISFAAYGKQAPTESSLCPFCARELTCSWPVYSL